LVPLDQHDARHEGFALFAHLALDAPARADAEIAEFTDLIGGVPALHHAVELFRTLVERVAAELLSDGTNGVSVIDAATNSVTATIPFSGAGPGVAVSPDGTKVYVVTFSSNSEPAVSVIATKSNMVIATIPLGIGAQPQGLAVSPDGSRVYVANQGSNTVSVIATATDMVTATIPVGVNPLGVAVTPDSSKVYVANFGSGTISAGTVSVIDAATNMVTATIPDGGVNPYGLAVTPDGTKVYVANNSDRPGDVSVIATATNTVSTTIGVGSSPAAFGQFIQPLILTGKPGSANCHDESAAALALQLGGLAHAADTLGFASVKALQDTIKAFCAPVTN